MELSRRVQKLEQREEQKARPSIKIFTSQEDYGAYLHLNPSWSGLAIIWRGDVEI